ncbi:L-Lysine-8-amino-7-oxononanoate aminotransferase [compost metagenome]
MKAGSRKHGAFAHGLTYAAHPVAAAVALETLNVYRDRDIVGHVREVAPYFLEKLNALATHPLVGQVRGVGLLAAVEKAARKPFDPAAGMGAWIQNRAMEYGVIVRAIANCVALCPPLISERSHIDELVDGLARALDDALAHARENKWL